MFQKDGLSDDYVSAEFLENVPSLISSEDNSDLMKPFSENEILDVIWAMELDKAPRADGFSFHFYRVSWSIIKSDLIPYGYSLPKKSKSGRVY